MAFSDVRENSQNPGTRRMPNETMQQDENQEVPHGVAEYLYKERKKIQLNSELTALRSHENSAMRKWGEEKKGRHISI
jgi:hypothetical protein